MRTRLLLAAALVLTSPLRGQGLRLPGPPLVSRQSHVGDGALIGAAVGGFAGTFVGLADRNHICPARLWLCKGPGASLVSMITGLTAGGMLGGVTGAAVGAFVKTSGRETQVGLTVPI